MKSDTERKKYYSEKLHKRKKRICAHLSKELRAKLKNKKRSLQVRKGDTVKIMRGPRKGKEAKISKVNVVKRKVYLEGITVTNARAREVFIPLDPSNLLLTGLEATPERKKMFAADVFKLEKPKTEPEKVTEEKTESKEKVER
ncbi:50S ribosomal protein L24 [Candidatus Micrarchaeota archaeon]|nr:50S ribosomal protein L24 [Candidatus Micrarchaeota archaeon]